MFGNCTRASVGLLTDIYYNYSIYCIMFKLVQLIPEYWPPSRTEISTISLNPWKTNRNNNNTEESPRALQTFAKSRNLFANKCWTKRTPSSLTSIYIHVYLYICTMYIYISEYIRRNLTTTCELLRTAKVVWQTQSIPFGTQSLHVIQLD